MVMSGPQPSVYEFGEFRIEAGKRLLLRDGAPVPLTPKAFDTLLLLVQNRQRIVEKDELMQAIWPDTTVEENNLNQNISTLQRVLGESRGENRSYGVVIASAMARSFFKSRSAASGSNGRICTARAHRPARMMSESLYGSPTVSAVSHAGLASIGSVLLGSIFRPPARRQCQGKPRATLPTKVRGA